MPTKVSQVLPIITLNTIDSVLYPALSLSARFGRSLTTLKQKSLRI